MESVTTSQARVGAVPRTFLTVGGESVRAVLRRVDALLAEQATRNAADCLAREEAAQRDHERTLADLTVLERRASEVAR
jgi:hypothetical protein